MYCNKFLNIFVTITKYKWIILRHRKIFDNRYSDLFLNV